MQELYKTENEDDKGIIKQEIADWMDSIASTSLLGDRYRHICNDGKEKDFHIVSEEHLRILRHKDGCRKAKRIFVNCVDCDRKFSCESLGNKILTNKIKYPFPIELEKTSISKVQLTKMQMMVPIFDINHNADIVNALENIHASHHRKACF